MFSPTFVTAIQDALLFFAVGTIVELAFALTLVALVEAMHHFGIAK